MAKVKFEMEEIRLIMEAHAKSKFALTGSEVSYFDAEVDKDGQVVNVEFIIDSKEQ